MCESVDEPWKDRMKAEYYQLKDRFLKLDAMLAKHYAGKLDFEPKSPISLLRCQHEHMQGYLHCLRIRAEIEGVDL